VYDRVYSPAGGNSVGQEVTQEQVLDALREVYDPEIGINVVDLGLVYRVEVHGGNVDVDLTMTAPGCPVYGPMVEMAEEAIRSVPGVRDVHVQLVWDPPWTPDRMAEDVRRALGFA
jgi:FeS assembly SUF system protein